MLFTENYLNYVKEVPSDSWMDYEVLSIDDLALLPRKLSFSETSSNGIASHDSGHDSYLEDGTGYSGDDEESVKCDLCLNGQGKVNQFSDGNVRKPKRHRRSRKNRNKRRAKKSNKEKDVIVLRELPKNDNFEFEGEKKVEMKWTLECFMDISLMPKLKRVIIDRGRPEDLGADNLLVFDESSGYCKIQDWRQNMLQQLGARNEKQVKAFNLLPSYTSCDSCAEQRQKEIQDALGIGRGFCIVGETGSATLLEAQKISNGNDTKQYWRRRIINDLKLNNCRSQACMRALKRDRILTTSYPFTSRRRRNPKLEKVDEEDWEVYEIISDDEFLDMNNFI